MAKKSSAKKTRKTSKKSIPKKAAAKSARKSAKAIGKHQTAKKAVARKAAAKKASKKTAKKVAKKSVVKKTVSPSDQQTDWLPVVLIVLGAIVLIYAVFSLFSGDAPEQVVESSEVAAVVNGVEIMQTQLDTQYAILPDQYKQVYTKDLILQQLIDEQLVIEEAQAAEVTVSDEEVNQEVQSILDSGELSLVDLQENLANFNLTIEDFENLIERKILIEEGMQLILADVEEPTQAELQAFYNANKSQFVQEPQVSVRHILIASQRENAAELGLELKEQVEEGDDFCDLVEEYSDDKGSVDNCGEYTFGRGFMVPAFEEAAFTLEPGNVTMVQTTFGYHVIEKLEDIPETTLSFSDVEDQIRSTLLNQKQVEAYQAFLEQAKADAEIVKN